MKKVLLTGISGYIAMHCAKELLKRDYHINATVRNLDKVEDIKKALSALSLDVNKIQFFQADLLSNDNWEDAMADCEYVMHVASPYPLNQPKDENVLIKPAVEGTERVVSLAIKNNVKKIVLTSSVVAVSVGHTKKQYSEEYNSFVNGQHTTQGGTHLSALKESIVKTIRDHFKKPYDSSDIRKSVLCAISIKVMEPVFESQTKTKLGSTEMGGDLPTVRTYINDFVGRKLDNFLHQNQNLSLIHI